MSTFEYNDLFLLAQDSGKYHVFTFDIVGSKKMDTQTRRDAQIKSIKLIKGIYSVLSNIQEKLNRKILVFEDGFVPFDSPLPRYEFGMKQEPFILGDVFGFTIYRDSLDTDTVLSIYEYFKESLEIDFEYHLANGYYETNNYAEGGTKCFRGYCIDLLSNYHKENTIKDLNRLRKELKIPNSN